MASSSKFCSVCTTNRALGWLKSPQSPGTCVSRRENYSLFQPALKHDRVLASTQVPVGLTSQGFSHNQRQSTVVRLSSAIHTSNSNYQRLETAQSGKLTDIGVRTVFSAEHDIFRSSVRKFLEVEVVPHHDRFVEQGIVDKEIWEKSGTNGFLGVAIPVEHGGLGSDFLTQAIVNEELMYANVSGLGGYVVHSDIVMPFISHYGSPEQRARYLPDMTAGRSIGCIALTEPAAGSDLQGIRTTAKKDGDDWILNGSKVFITNGILADVVIVVALTDVGAKSPAHGLSLFLVDKDRPGFTKGRNLKKLGLHAGDTAELFFEDVRLPSNALLGPANRGFMLLMAEMPQERLSIAVLAAAAAEYMFEETRRYVTERKAFGKTISKLQTVQHNLAEMKTEICIARTFVDRCIQLHNQKRLDSQMASMAKYWTSELQNKVAARCLQLHGGWGYMMEYPIARCYVDSRGQTIYGGTTEIMKELIARHIV